MSAKLCKECTNLSELIFYLEEMCDMGMINGIESEIYERYCFGKRLTTSDFLYLHNQMEKWQSENF